MGYGHSHRFEWGAYDLDGRSGIEFLKKNRMFEVLGLFILMLVGVMLISDGGHLAHMHLFGHAINPMSKANFYFIIFILVAIDIVQSNYQRKLLRRRIK